MLQPYEGVKVGPRFSELWKELLVQIINIFLGHFSNWGHTSFFSRVNYKVSLDLRVSECLLDYRQLVTGSGDYISWMKFSYSFFIHGNHCSIVRHRLGLAPWPSRFDDRERERDLLTEEVELSQENRLGNIVSISDCLAKQQSTTLTKVNSLKVRGISRTGDHYSIGFFLEFFPWTEVKSQCEKRRRHKTTHRRLHGWTG